ncbi:protein fan [Plakobranchus ocellatus]|uniref:Protein fan n=1 Tax=Plakobranchus ocellatus TaxID=259542 RepID=A0AAV4ADF4_9GAST|nr:protein fan [Plakobranchus ocellatus]
MGGSITIKISLILLVIGLIIFVIGFAAPYWYSHDYEIGPSVLDSHRYKGTRHTGLWLYCDVYDRWDGRSPNRKVGRVHVDECREFLAYDHLTITSELRATQFFETMGLIGLVATFVLLMLGLCMESCHDRRILPIIASVLCLASAGSIILGTIIYGSAEAHQDYLSWAFALTIVSGVIFVVTGFIILVGAIVNK